jgi:hypothetical protein
MMRPAPSALYSPLPQSLPDPVVTHQDQLASAAAPLVNGTHQVTAPSGDVFNYNLTLKPPEAPLFATALGASRPVGLPAVGPQVPGALLGLMQGGGVPVRPLARPLPARGVPFANTNAGWLNAKPSGWMTTPPSGWMTTTARPGWLNR